MKAGRKTEIVHEYEGMKISFKLLSWYTGIPETTLRSRYNRGLRDDQLTQPMKMGRPKGSTKY